VASHSANSLKRDLEQALSDSRNLAASLGRMIETATDYDLIRQLKKVDAELLDVQHNIRIAIEMEEKTNG
jgi:hypothetical protein